MHITCLYMYLDDFYDYLGPDSSSFYVLLNFSMWIVFAHRRIMKVFKKSIGVAPVAMLIKRKPIQAYDSGYIKLALKILPHGDNLQIYRRQEKIDICSCA